MEWRLDIQNAPKDEVILAMAKYPGASAGFPTFVMWTGDHFSQLSRLHPQRMICWAWMSRDVLPKWPEMPEEVFHAL